jgi:hypothetical protein
MYSINDVDFFMLAGGLTTVPDLRLDNQESRERQQVFEWELPANPNTRYFELVMSVRNAHELASYYCDIEGTNKITRAWPNAAMGASTTRT